MTGPLKLVSNKSRIIFFIALKRPFFKVLCLSLLVGLASATFPKSTNELSLEKPRFKRDLEALNKEDEFPDFLLDAIGEALMERFDAEETGMESHREKRGLRSWWKKRGRRLLKNKLRCEAVRRAAQAAAQG